MITKGNLLYRVLEPSIDEYELDVDCYGVVAPQVAHQVAPNGPVNFHVAFFSKSA